MTIDIQRFCASPDEDRYWLRSPWRADGCIYASNGHLAISIPDDGRELPQPGGRYPNMTALFGKPVLGLFVPLPELEPVSVCGVCDRCAGFGKHGRVDCDECFGRGEFDHKRYTYRCMGCEGEGEIGNDAEPTLCLACDGFGEPGAVPLAHRTVIGDHAGFQTRYLRAFADLPNVQIAVGGPTDMAHIRFDGGRGAVMPMKENS